ncbi:MULTISPECIES: hypothetical protein [unclassified Streptomyces]|uniref:hypothetical protein n=1 Tax=unclassified Streptomyces TaxID=2593676 RepID=UPI00114CAAC0|nr:MULTISPECIES: hypothetical protein [unclassified Streptomyces]MYS22367.1 hypothetical protein [Streptomyces sp. SID4948]
MAVRIWLAGAAIYVAGVLVNLLAGDLTGLRLAWSIAGAALFAGSAGAFTLALRRTEGAEGRQR